MKNHTQAVSLSIALAAAVVFVAGCSSSMQPSAGEVVRGHALQGRVLGGQQPIAFSTLALYAAGGTGYGSAFPYTTGTSLLGSHVVQSDAGGNFNFTGDYTCPQASTQVYLVATGGNPGDGVNPNAALMAALGPCGNLGSSTFINLNELTTVAAVWSLSGFMTGISNIGVSPANAAGLVNAFSTANKLVNFTTGSTPGLLLPSGATLPVTKINTLGNILAACINSTGGTHGDGSPCGTLFANTAVNGVFPTDTVGAALNMAQNPNQNVSTLTNLATPASPFQPSLVTSPNDFALVVSHTGGGISSPSGIAVDGQGNIWTANAGNNSASKLNNLGATISGADGFVTGPLSAPSAIAVDGPGNAWLTNQNNTVVRLNPTGTAATVFSGGNLNLPSAIAIDASGNAWVANNGNSTLTQITSAGVLSNFTGGSASAPSGIAIQPK